MPPSHTWVLTLPPTLDCIWRLHGCCYSTGTQLLPPWCRRVQVLIGNMSFDAMDNNMPRALSICFILICIILLNLLIAMMGDTSVQSQTPPAVPAPFPPLWAGGVAVVVRAWWPPRPFG